MALRSLHDEQNKNNTYKILNVTRDGTHPKFSIFSIISNTKVSLFGSSLDDIISAILLKCVDRGFSSSSPSTKPCKFSLNNAIARSNLCWLVGPAVAPHCHGHNHQAFELFVQRDFHLRYSNITTYHSQHKYNMRMSSNRERTS